MSVEQMFSMWATQLDVYSASLKSNIEALSVVPLGSELSSEIVSVQSVENTYGSHKKALLSALNDISKVELSSAEDRLTAMTQLTAIVQLSAQVSNLATSLLKLANDVRFLASGPRSGIGELTIPENEPGSSIMPGKVNPTQCESLTMISAQVIGNHTAVSIANANALFESNNFKPLIANNTLRSVRITADGLRSFRKNCAVGIEIIERTVEKNLKSFI